MDQSKETLAKAVCAAFSLPWESEEALSFIRYAYQEDAVSPQPSRETDVLYIDLNVMSDRATNWTHTTFGADKRVQIEQSVTLDGALTFYGPHADTYAEHLHTVIMLDTGPGSPRDILRQGNIIIESKPEAPSVSREPDADMWRKRADLRLRLNLLRTVSLDYNRIAGTPDVSMSVQP